MGRRHEGREAAIQFLVYCDLNQGAAVSGANATDEAAFWALRPAAPKKVRDFALELARGALHCRVETDKRISGYAQNYELHRLAAVDRNILRLALYEMFYRDDIPPVVSINEAIEIAKKYGTEESGRFVNGILDRAKLDLDRPLRTARPAAEKIAPSAPTPSPAI
ncbi:MAG: transcription antitermination factor NusB [Verrucomicrobia bacterium]|nr:transcription antitermination factor NusB [Verrucomicrobiota bacterium]MBV9656922.1 transcription antitermination factor NusB [Verrucomicrobiota bacterium]